MYRSIRRILTVSCVALGVVSLVPATQTSYGQGGNNGNLALPWPGFPFANGGFRVGMPSLWSARDPFATGPAPVV